MDDETLLLEVFQDFFNREPGFTITTCTNATDALEQSTTQSFDAIIADYGLPDMDGINLLREIRARGFLGIFIIITGKHRAHVAIDALNNGADYYIQKGGGMVNDMSSLVEFIRDTSSVKYLIVTIPEALGVKMTNRVISELEENHLSVENIVINNVVREADCEFHRFRKAMQEHYINELTGTYRGKELTVLYLAPHEIKGMDRISDVARSLFG